MLSLKERYFVSCLVSTSLGLYFMLDQKEFVFLHSVIYINPRMFFLDKSHSRSSRLRMFFKVGVLKNLVNFTGKNPCVGISFIKKEPATLLKKRLQHRYFSVKFAKLLRTPFFTEPLRWLLLTLIKTFKVPGNLNKNFQLLFISQVDKILFVDKFYLFSLFMANFQAYLLPLIHELP